MTDVWSRPTACELCGVTGQPLSVQLVEWRDALPGMTYSHVGRCLDRSACQGRYQEANKGPVREGART